jgi:hypothetical protein
MTQRILLATTVVWPSAARLASALAGLGARIEAVCPQDHVLRLSRHLSRAYDYRALAPETSFETAILASEPDLIVPCDDRAMRALLALDRPQFHALFERSLGRLGSYPLLMARAEAIAAARAEGLAAPETLLLNNETDLGEAIYEFGLPLVLKSDGSWGGDGVAVVRSQQAAFFTFRKLSRAPSRLRSLVRAVQRGDAHFLAEAMAPKAATVIAQRFVLGTPATSAFSCRDGEVLAALHMDVVAWQDATGPASVLRPVRCALMDQACRRIARRFALSGFIGLDFVRDRRGVPHLIEINPRTTQICHLALDTDPAAALLGQPARAPVTDKALIALFPQAKSLDPNGVLADAYWDLPWDDSQVLLRILGRDGDFAARAWPPEAAGRPEILTLRDLNGPLAPRPDQSRVYKALAR